MKMQSEIYFIVIPKEKRQILFKIDLRIPLTHSPNLIVIIII